MNYLTHAYLSFEQPELLVGNMISDFVKGKQQFEYTIGVQQGIKLHRAIDAFTDNHKIIAEAKLIFKPTYRLYSGAFIDVVMDYYLANKLQKEIEFKLYTEKLYIILENRYNVFPTIFQPMFLSMRQHNWLYNYQHKEGIQKSFKGLQRRAKYITETETAFNLFQENEEKLSNYFNQFWPQLENFAKKEIQPLTPKGELGRLEL